MSAETRRNAWNRLARGLDVLFIGGGINGAGSVRDLALRARTADVPLRIGLVDKNHFGSGTSSRNSQLIHGGLRYLKNFDFKLVSEALRERGTLLKIAPHLVEPLPFLIPMRNLPSAVFYGIGLFLYDLLAGKYRIERHRHVTGAELHRIEPRMRRFFSGARFYDGFVNSARLVILNIRDACESGALVLNYCAARAMNRTPDGSWEVDLEDTLGGLRQTISAKTIVETTGAWSRDPNLRLVRGSHIILPRLGASDNAVSYFREDGRVVFFIPWGSKQQLTLVGTTEADHTEGPDRVHISPEELRYLLEAVEEVFPGRGAQEPISSYSSLRPLVRDEGASATKTSREHRIWADDQGMIHVIGGKYTTYRLMSEETVDLLTRTHWPKLATIHLTAETALPDPDDASLESMDEAARIAFAVRSEFVERLADLLYVSTYWGYERKWDAALLEPIARELGRRLGWDDDRVQQEIADVLSSIAHSPLAQGSLPAHAEGGH
jgi:glycerol-3-phosphate dehydrogenase